MSISRIGTSLVIALLAAPALFTVQPAFAAERYMFASVNVQRFTLPSRTTHDRELDQKNEDEANWAQQQREEQARNDESTANAIAAAQASANQQNQ